LSEFQYKLQLRICYFHSSITRHQAYSAWARPLWQAATSTRRKLGQ